MVEHQLYLMKTDFVVKILEQKEKKLFISDLDSLHRMRSCQISFLETA